MKNTAALVVFSLCAFALNAQEIDTIQVVKSEIGKDLALEVDTVSTIIQDGSTYSFAFSWDRRSKRSPHTHWSGLSFSFLNFDDAKMGAGDLKRSMSYSVSWNLIDFSSRMGNSNFIFGSGMGLDWSRYHFGGNVALTKDGGKAVFKPAPDGVDYKSSKLLAYYVTIPLLVEYQPKGGVNFHLSAGVVGFIKYYSKSQVKYIDSNNKEVKHNMGRDLYMRTIDAKLRVQAGIGSVSAFGYYSPFSMFEKGKGPDIKPYSIGLSFGF